jgi:hypothetical protein
MVVKAWEDTQRILQATMVLFAHRELSVPIWLVGRKVPVSLSRQSGAEDIFCRVSNSGRPAVSA